MKNFFVIILLIFMTIPVYANVENLSPKWEDFVISKYSGNLNYIENNTFYKKHPALATLSAMTLVGAPSTIISQQRSIKIEENNYWYKRKEQFDSEINMCKQMKENDNKINCYMAVSHNEQNKNAQREQLLLQKEQMARNTVQNYQLQNSINRPKTYYRSGNYIYSY